MWMALARRDRIRDSKGHIACGFHLGFIEIVIGIDWLRKMVSKEGKNATVFLLRHVNDVSMLLAVNHHSSKSDLGLHRVSTWD